MYIENFWGGRGSSKYYHGYIEGGWGYKSPKNVLRSMWLIPYMGLLESQNALKLSPNRLLDLCFTKIFPQNMIIM